MNVPGSIVPFTVVAETAMVKWLPAGPLASMVPSLMKVPAAPSRLVSAVVLPVTALSMVLA